MSGEFLCPVSIQLNLDNPSVEQMNNLSLNHNPLHCLLCTNQLNEPVSLPCHHVFCKPCVLEFTRSAENTENVESSAHHYRATATVRCPLCAKEVPEDFIGSKIRLDGLVKYLVDSAQEQSDLCANCDMVSTSNFKIFIIMQSNTVIAAGTTAYRR